MLFQLHSIHICYLYGIRVTEDEIDQETIQQTTTTTTTTFAPTIKHEMILPEDFKIKRIEESNQYNGYAVAAEHKENMNKS